MTSVNYYEGYCEYCDCLSEHLVYSDAETLICMECVCDCANQNMSDVKMRWNEVEEKVELVERPVKEKIANVCG